MRTLDQVRAMFPVGAEVECVKNTLRPELNGSRRRVTEARKAWLAVDILTGPNAGAKHFRMALPQKVMSIVELAEDHITFMLGRAEHTATFRVLPGGSSDNPPR